MARGRLRIYLGAAPGVGKTVAMLDEGHRRLDRGTDVVVGLVETHERAHTKALIDGLEVVPRARLTHRGTTLEEMDLDGLLARAPRVALVDELAHTNAPGSRHEKRWQDIDELLDAGIDVISTVNVQHLESLNDVVTSITGVVQRETVPDAVVRAADQIELVDMSPEALRRRMAHGNVYAPEKVDAALANYFRVGNLSALRELALLWLADRVDEGLETYRADHGIDASWPTRERVVVAISGAAEGETLLRRGARIAARGAGGELLAVHVVRSDGLTGPTLPDLVAQRRLTDELGGTFHTVTGDDLAEAVLDFARGVNASQVVIGSSRRPRWRTLLSPSTTEEVITESGDIDVHVVTHKLAAGRGWRAPRAGLPRRRKLLGYGLGVVGPFVLTEVLAGLPEDPDLPLTVPLFLLLSVLTALLGGMGPALLGAVASSLFLNWFFTPPTGGLTISEPENAVALAVFVLVAAAVAWVVDRSARRADRALRAQAESASLAELSHTLLGSTDQMALLLQQALDMFGADAAAVVRRPDAHHRMEVVSATDPSLTLEDLRAPGLPREEADEDHELVLVGATVPAGRQRLLAAFAAHAGAILQRRSLQASAGEAAVLARDNSARTALLSAVSHDLRTPLAGIKAAIGSLRSTEVTFSPEDEAELEAAIEDSADRLEVLIGNLLDMSRLQAGALVANPRTVDLGEVVPGVVAAVAEPERVVWDLGADARTVVADAGLLDRVLGNVVENALRHQQPPWRVRVATSRLGDRVQIRVCDTGPGVPEAARDRIFLPFQRYGDAPAGDGVGLGLAVARGLAEAMGGSVSAEDTPGGGLTVVVELPVAEGA
ncbi:sensor histidine kinase [Phycicoccus sonneratiae]|uniref:histidine kinase n=1 Tax=Phycicoccus sonneratiae TaxID=2807628 RepID=A0ABS2CR62_9MICO|nr:ATP-binding protein [Phycicoccus sonneraticus]MBM6402379.1 sensor histidine kinase KdpD [Phycicoccus sonneraticus]